MKNRIILLIFSITLLFCNTDIIAQNKPTNTDSLYTKVGATLPNFEMQTIDSTIYKTSNLSGKNNILLMLFNPGCSHCIDFTKILMQNRKTNLKDFDIVLMTGEKMGMYLGDFYKATNLKPSDDILVGTDKTGITFDLFIYKGIPQVMCYDKNKTLLKIFATDPKLENILGVYNLKANAITKDGKVDEKYEIVTYQKMNGKTKTKKRRIKK